MINIIQVNNLKFNISLLKLFSCEHFGSVSGVCIQKMYIVLEAFCVPVFVNRGNALWAGLVVSIRLSNRFNSRATDWIWIKFDVEAVLLCTTSELYFYISCELW